MHQKDRLRQKNPESDFDSYYLKQYKETWEVLKSSLKEDKPLVNISEIIKEVSIKEPYYLDPASVQCALNLPVNKNSDILDMCAAPGGKSMLAYELTSANGQGENAAISGGTVVSRDISENKIEKIKENAERLGIFVDVEREVEERTGFMLEIGDATALDKSISELKDDDKFDVVIADVPCSGLGVIGKVLRTSVEESVLKDGKVDIDSLEAIAFDPYTHGYYKVGGRVGEAFRDGLKIR